MEPGTKKKAKALVGAFTSGDGRALDYYSAEGGPRPGKIIDVFHCRCPDCLHERARLAHQQQWRDYEAADHLDPLERLARRLHWQLCGRLVNSSDVELAALVLAFVEAWGGYFGLLDAAIAKAVGQAEKALQWDLNAPVDTGDGTPHREALDSLLRNNARLFSTTRLKEESVAYLARKIVLFHNTGRMANDFCDGTDWT